MRLNVEDKQESWEEALSNIYFHETFKHEECLNKTIEYVKSLIEAEVDECIVIAESMKHEAIMSTGLRKEERIDGKELVEKLKAKNRR